MTATVPSRGPRTVGVKVIGKIQLPPAAKVLGALGQVVMIAKSPDEVIVDMVNGDGRLFLKVMFWAAVALFTTWLPKANIVVDNATGIRPVPVRFAV